MAGKFKEIEHTADWAFQVRGDTLQDLFITAAHALFALEEAKSEAGPESVREIRIEGSDQESMLVNWLNELLYLQETRHEVYDQFEVLSLSASRLLVRVHGRRQKAISKVIKAATFHGLEIIRAGKTYVATIVVDV